MIGSARSKDLAACARGLSPTSSTSCDAPRRWRARRPLAPRVDSHQHLGGEFFSWWDLGEDRFLGEILCRDEQQEFYLGRVPSGKLATAAGSRWDLGKCQASWRDPGGMDSGNLFYNGRKATLATATETGVNFLNYTSSSVTVFNSCGNCLYCSCCYFCTAKLAVTKCSFELDLMKKKNSIEGVASHVSF